MNATEREIRAEYRYTDLNYIFDVYMECEYRTNFSDNEYEGLNPGEFRFDYNSWGNRLGFTKKQMERAINELSKKKLVIIQIERGKRGTCSKYFLARFEEKKKENNEENIKRIVGEEKSLENTSFESGEGEQKGSYKEKNEEKKKEQSSKYINLSIISNNIYSHWNSKKIIVHKSLTKEMERAIEKVLKEYSDSEIVQAISIYSEMLESEFYFNYKWSLVDFLNRKNGISTFMAEGSNKTNYESWKKEREHNANTSRYTKRDRGVFNKDSEKIRIELPEREFKHYTNEELADLGID
ncbi:hypothetical protein AB2T63_12240 [Clostridium butyricum]|uniref:Uncharacterized protein n=1 Tax=Clostridium butyricum TaxID=1492 RepID=A0A2S7FCT4_CLOBU|nr:hypothetical protein [Clostridium butyricum]PPV16036.1 hypothetical protein AWN73_10840 [Clostridium butyricum]